MKKTIALLLLLISLTVNAEDISTFGDAKWIGATVDANDSQAGQSVWLKRSFNCHKSVKQAVLYVSGLGAYEVYLNHKKIDDALLSPAWSDYNKSVFYNEIDITDQLCLKNTKDKIKKIGSDNIIYVLLGNGFYHEDGVRYHKLKVNNGPLTLLFHLVIKYKDGSVEDINSDDKQWLVRKSPITYNSIYGGEDYDAGLEDFTNTDSACKWCPAVVQTAPKGKLFKQICEPVKIMQVLPVARMLNNNVFDMGQNMAGFPLLEVTGKAGQTVKIIVGETLTSDGHVSQKRTGAPYSLSYTLRGKSESPFNDNITYRPESKLSEVWHPHFTYYGYRYIEIHGAVMKGSPNPDGLPIIEEIKSCFISNAAAKIGSFECSNTLFNDTYKIIDKAVRSNWMSVWTDCPHREKLGWLEQDWLNMPGLMCNYDCKKMYKQEMHVIADAIHDDGSMPEIAPEYVRFEGSWAPPFQESPEWGGAIVAIPFMYADFYGDTTLINLYRPQMKRYLDYLTSKSKDDILDMGLGDWYDVGPNKPGFSQNTLVALVATAHYYRWTKMLGYNERADRIKQAFLKTFKPDSQAAYSMMLVLGLYADGQKQSVVDALVADIHKHGDRLNTGDIGTPYLFKALLDNGKAGLLFKMIDQNDGPGYGIQLQKGMTTLTESWNPLQASSQNHFMLATINNHLIQDVVGIHVSAKEIDINPRLTGNLTWAKGSTKTNYGEVSVSWRVNNSDFILDIVTPNKNITKINYEEINSMCSARNLKLQCNIRQK